MSAWNEFTTITTQNMLIKWKSDFWTYTIRLTTVTFNPPSNEWWLFTLKPQIRLLPHKRTNNDHAMLFSVTAARTALSINYYEKNITWIYKSYTDF